MALTSVYYDGPVTETDRARNLAGAPEYGVYGQEDFKVTAHPSIPYAVLVKAGRAHGHGVTDTADIDQVVQCSTLASGTRWDLIAVRRNWQPSLGGPSTLVAIPGGATAEIPAARKVGPGVEDDQPIALVKWQGGLSAPAQIIDLRVWASNGSLFATNDLVRTYLTGVGTEVSINGAKWAIQIGANEVASWARVAEAGKAPLYGVGVALNGTVPPDTTGFLTQAGSFVAKTNDQAATRLVFPNPFPNGLLTVIISSGDLVANGLGVSFDPVGGSAYGTSSLGDRLAVVYVATSAAGAKLPQLQHRINYIAIGW